jgi:hypothetical protein
MRSLTPSVTQPIGSNRGSDAGIASGAGDGHGFSCAWRIRKSSTKSGAARAALLDADTVLPFLSMIHLLLLAVHLLATIAKLLRPGGVRVVVAESLLLKHQLLISSRARRRSPNLNSLDRFVLGLGSLFVPASRIRRHPEAQNVMVVMDVFTRRIIGFGVERTDLCGVSVCRMFNQIIAGKSLPKHLIPILRVADSTGVSESRAA